MSNNSPLKSLSVREDKGRRSLHVKLGEKFYKSVSNFYFSIYCFVEFPSIFGRFNGYVVDVQRMDNVSKKCYVTCEEMASSKSFVNAINRSFSCKGGILWESVSDSQLRKYLMKELEEFNARPEGNDKKKKAALVVGRQPDSGVYVLSESVQINEMGKLIDEDDQEYLFMPPFLTGISIPSSDVLLKEYLRSTPLKLNVPLMPFNWRTFIKACKNFFGNNFFQFLMFLSGGISAFHYQRILDVVGSCPAPMAVGDTASGKSTCLRLIQRLLGGVLLSQSSGESVSSELIRSTLPVYWDDPAHANTVKKVLVSTFQGGGKQTKGSGNEIPLTTFLITVNFTLDDDLRSFERTTPILFEKIINESGVEHIDFFEQRKQVFKLASYDCLPSVVRMSEGLTEFNLEEHILFFTDGLKGFPSRLPSIYSCYRYFAFEVIDLVADDDIVNKTELDGYLQSSLIPYVITQYGKSRKVKATLHAFLSDVVAAVANGKCELSDLIKPNVKQRSTDQQGAAIHLCRKAVTSMLDRAKTPYSLDDLRNICAGVNGANYDFRSNFGPANGPRVATVKIPRDAVEDGTLEIIDSWFEHSETTANSGNSTSDDDEAQKDKCTTCPLLQQKLNTLTKECKRLEAIIFNQTEESRAVICELQSKLLSEKLKNSTLTRELQVVKQQRIQLQEDTTPSEAEIKNTSRRPPSLVNTVRALITEKNSETTEGISSVEELNKSPGPCENNDKFTAEYANESAENESAEKSEKLAGDKYVDQAVKESDNSTIMESDKSSGKKSATGKQSEKLKRKRKRDDKDHCNLCTYKKKSHMVQCTSCLQWQHFKCANVTMSKYSGGYVCQLCA